MLYVTELNDCVRAIDLIKNEVFTLCGSGNGENGFIDGDSKTAMFNFPYGVTSLDYGKSLAITESDNHCIRIIDIIGPY
jgi:hypothetical protein